MSSETSARISACSKLFGQQLEEKDIGQLQEMAKAIGIDDKDTMFLLLLVLDKVHLFLHPLLHKNQPQLIHHLRYLQVLQTEYLNLQKHFSQ